MQQQSELREGWVECQMSDISDVGGGGTPKTSEPNFFSENGIPWITPADLSGYNEIFISKGNRSLSEEGLKSCSAKLMPTGTVLMSSRAPIGYIAIAANPISTNQGFKSFVCHDGIFPEYVYFWLKFKKPLIESMGSGSTFKEVSGSRAKTIPVDIPPVAEQHRIVSAIEALFARLDAANERLDRVPEILKKFRQSVLATACEGRLTEEWRTLNEDKLNLIDSLNNLDIKNIELDVSNDYDSAIQPNIPQEWKWSRCNDLCDQNRALTYGVIKLGPETEDGIPTLRSSDVRWLKIDNIHIKRISPEIASNYSRTYLKGGEILVTVRGTLGGVAVVPKNMKGFNISREVAVIPLLSILNAHFFCYAIASKRSQNWLLGMKKGVAYIGINIKDLKNLPLPIPPLSEQHEIVRRVDALFALADSIEAKVTAARERTEKLRQSVLAKAFSGELVETEAELARREGRDYEPADVLLERIKAEQGKSGKKGKAAKGKSTHRKE